MTDAEKIAMVKTMSGETDEEVVSVYLALAKTKLLRYAYPYDNTVTEMPEEWGMNHVEVASFLLDKRGAEGETAHGENGISRTYGGADIPADMLRGIVPKAGVPQ